MATKIKSQVKSKTPKTSKTAKTSGITTIYSITDKYGKYLYIGETKRHPEERFAEHLKKLTTGKHNKLLQKAYDTDNNIKFNVELQLPTENTLVAFFVEALMNSIKKPSCCKAVISQGRMRIILQRCDVDIAERIVSVIMEYYKVI